MQNYIFYTPEGICTSPSGDGVENFQVLGFAKGATRDDAFLKLLGENEWIDKMGYDHDQIISRGVK